MKELEKGKDKIKEICNALRQETLEPAKDEAARIIENAKKEAQNILEQAHQKVQVLHVEAKSAIQKEREIFNASLKEASKLSIASLKQDLEEELFSKNFHEQLRENAQDPQILAKLLNALVESIEKEGINSQLSALIPSKIDPAKVVSLLKEKAINKLKEGIAVGNFDGGVKLKIKDDKITLDLSDEALFTLFEKHLRKEFRKWLT